MVVNSLGTSIESHWPYFAAARKVPGMSYAAFVLQRVGTGCIPKDHK